MLKELNVFGMSEKALERRSKKFDELYGLILRELNEDNDIAYCTLEDYKNDKVFNEEDDSHITYAFNEFQVWNYLFKICGVDDEIDLMEKFVNARFCYHENLMVVELVDRKICVLRL
ncbi:hypothetical protein [Clostridium saccharoperbutylacetonicum]|uniref:hypothetical protein n=1 Tax=Clostridium saccharoperbutylacetonicum TaxID=36745 RepID=UPI0039EAE863